MIQKNDCIGCQACVDFCPQKAISFQYDEWGEGKAIVDKAVCNNCGFCELNCPSLINSFNPAQKNVYAAISRKNHSTGSSGGVFYELGKRFIQDGGVVFGAAFDSNMKLIHKKACCISELTSLCKSKYLHSDMQGVYSEISNCLKSGTKVMFVGTPCQVSAVKNLFFKKYREQLFLIDFLCHGTGTQKIFDLCIQSEEEKRKVKITNFFFRAKTRKSEHSFKYCLNDGKTITGYAFEFPYYYSYLKYVIFCDSCYKCKYTTSERVGDITLGDFWGIQNYSKKFHDQDGISMISVNNEVGKNYFEQIKENCTTYQYPIENAQAKNQSFTECVNVSCYNKKKELESILIKQGEANLIENLSCPNIRKKIIYAKIPNIIKKIWNYRRGIK